MIRFSWYVHFFFTHRISCAHFFLPIDSSPIEMPRQSAENADQSVKVAKRTVESGIKERGTCIF